METWCCVCCTDHPPQVRCPGDVQLTGAEKRSWKVIVETPRGLQGYGVLMGEAGDRWRARIMTFPNIVWTVPGGVGSMKFLGRTEVDAERKAVSFIRRHCVHRGYLMRDELELVENVATRLVAPSFVDKDGARAAQRFPRVLPVHFGRNAPTIAAWTGNLSETGLFVNTRAPLPPGISAGLVLEAEHCKVPLRGFVVWNRPVPAPQRPHGMGLSLSDPPETYVRYIQALRS